MALSSLDRPAVVGGLRLVRLVGRGGEGEVWAARDARGRARALKLVRPECLAEPDEALRRGVWLTRIEHPSLVRVHRTGRLTDLPPRHFLAGWGFVEMDYVDGESLESAAPDPAVFQRLESLAEALDLLHDGFWSNGVPLVHRDVKPANIVEDAAGRLVLVDPSTLRGADATNVTRIGTPVFAPPEVAMGRSGPAADVYSFAATLVALGTGLRGGALADRLRDRDGLDLPAGVRAALSPRPEERPASCRAVLERSETIVLQSGPYPAPPDPGGDHDWLQEASGSAPAPAPRRAVLPWLLVVAAVCALPAAAAILGGLGGETPLVVAGIAAGLHLAAQLLGRGPLGLALVLPPLSWALLLARRLGGDRRRQAWASAILLVGITGMGAAPVLAFLEGRDGAARAGLAGGLGLTAALLGVAAARGTGRAGAVLRLVTLPLWLLGAASLVTLCLVALPFALLLGRAGQLLRRAGATLASVVEVARPPVRAAWHPA